MNYSNYRITLDIHNTGSQLLLKFNQNDSARKIIFTLTEGGKPYKLTSDCSCILSAVKPDGKELINTCTVDAVNGTIQYNVTQQTTSAPGTFDCQLTVTGADSAVISAPIFSIQVKEIVISDIDLESTSEFTALVEMYNGLGGINGRVSEAEGEISGLRGDLAGKLDMVTSSAPTGRAYCVTSDGAQRTRKLRQSEPEKDAIPLYNSNDCLVTGTPTNDIECANKQYVDKAVGDLNAALGDVSAAAYAHAQDTDGNPHAITPAKIGAVPETAEDIGTTYTGHTYAAYLYDETEGKAVRRSAAHTSDARGSAPNGVVLYDASGHIFVRDDMITHDGDAVNKKYVDAKSSIEYAIALSRVSMTDFAETSVTISDPTADYVIFDTGGRVMAYSGGRFSELTPDYESNYYSYSDWYISVPDLAAGRWQFHCMAEYGRGTIQILIARADRCSTLIGSGITCFIEGTRVLLRDKDTGEVTEKKIEDVQAGDYMAFWSPAVNRLSQTRAVVPPVVGECDKYDRLYFSDGRTVDVFGTQFFWDVDKDRLINWKQLVPGESRVCTDKGDIISFVRSEEIVPPAPVKHYTLMTFRSRYLANGIQVGDKVELFYPRLVRPEYIDYWNALTDADRAYFKARWADGMTRRNWKYSKAYAEAVGPMRKERAELLRTVAENQKYLNDTDYLVAKLAEGLISEEEFAEPRAKRQAARDAINAARDAIPDVDAHIREAEENVRAELAGTLKQAYVGLFAGKSRAVVEP